MIAGNYWWKFVRVTDRTLVMGMLLQKKATIQKAALAQKQKW